MRDDGPAGAATSGPRVGVLALQGGVAEHERLLRDLGASPVRVRRPADLDGLAALVVPGGESSVLDRLLDVAGLRDELRDAILDGLPTLGTCAGLVLLGARIANSAPGQRSLGLLDITVRRNAFGRQVDSHERRASWALPGRPASSYLAASIRAPEVVEVGPGVEVVSTIEVGGRERVVGVRQGHVLAISLHPELTGDPTVHEHLLDLARVQTARVTGAAGTAVSGVSAR